MSLSLSIDSRSIETKAHFALPVNECWYEGPREQPNPVPPTPRVHKPTSSHQQSPQRPKSHDSKVSYSNPKSLAYSIYKSEKGNKGYNATRVSPSLTVSPESPPCPATRAMEKYPPHLPSLTSRIIKIYSHCAAEPLIYTITEPRRT